MIQAQLMKYVATTVGPWLLKMLWPLIERFVADLAKDIFEKLRSRSREAVQEHLEKRRDEAIQNARSAELAASETPDEKEREALEASARVWREISQQLQSENESLKKQLTELMAAAEQEFDQKIKGGQPSIDASREVITLTVGDKRTALPALPPPKS